MLIKRISLVNFRQYIDTTIDFSTDPNKNVTIIMGDNGTGKTTLAQAFRWVLYGQTEFQIKELINVKVREQMMKGQEKSVSVTLDVLYNNIDYTIQRVVSYRKKLDESVEEFGQAKFVISYSNEYGNTEYLPDSEKVYFIKRLLPQDLSHFFFFDGEKIEEMADNIQMGKGEDFKEAVYSLVGLSATQAAIEHLKSRSATKNSVIKMLNAELDKNSQSQQKLWLKNQQIENINGQIEEVNAQINRLNTEIEKLEKEIDKNKQVIFSEKDKMQVKEDYLRLEDNQKKLINKKFSSITEDLLPTFQKGFFGFVATSLINKREIDNLLEEEIPQEKIIPGLTRKTLIHLLEQGECICGTKLQKDAKPYQALEELLEYAYPKTIVSLKEEYIKLRKTVEKEGADYYETLCRRIRYISEIDAQIEGISANMAEKMNQLANTDKGEEAKAALKRNESLLKGKRDSLVNAKARLQNLEADITKLENEKTKYIIVDDNTMRIQRYIEYANEIYKRFKSDYEKEETSYRNLLEAGMNRIFEVIYGGNISISIDSQYKISVMVREEFSGQDAVERNTAQSYALIFAFITAVIELAKRKVNDDATSANEFIDVEKEGYPLVMDAPLSAFDKTRIERICTEIPKIADQVIMFIKDTDGDIAEEHMAERIGMRCTAIKVNDSNLESTVVKEG